MSFRLIELAPRWLHSGEGRAGMGVSFECPCCSGTDHCIRLVVWFSNPIDGGTPMPGGTYRWRRIGDTFETLTLIPSVDASAPEPNGRVDWHGNITDGQCVGDNQAR